MVHVNGRENVHHAIESGVDSVEHGAYITDEELSMMAETGTVWTPTISPVANLRGLGRFDEESLERITAMQVETYSKSLCPWRFCGSGQRCRSRHRPPCKGAYGRVSVSAGGSRRTEGMAGAGNTGDGSAGEGKVSEKVRQNYG